MSHDSPPPAFDPLEIVHADFYKELRKLAAQQMMRRKYRTLQPTALVHEVWLRLVRQGRKCATTTRLNSIKLVEKPTVGVNLATHLYEFIREIRRRVDQYGLFFAHMQDYLASEKKAHPELKAYLEEMEAMVTDAQTKAKAIYTTSLPSVQTKTDAVKDLLLEATGDGFAFGNLDCRNTAGAQDDMCRHCNRLVMRLVQTAALKCGDSPQKAKIAKKIGDESRAVLRQPTRWESRRTLYFLEP